MSPSKGCLRDSVVLLSPKLNILPLFHWYENQISNEARPVQSTSVDLQTATTKQTRPIEDLSKNQDSPISTTRSRPLVARGPERPACYETHEHLLMKHQVVKYWVHRLDLHHQNPITVVLSTPNRTVLTNDGMKCSWKGVYLYIMPTEDNITTWNVIGTFKFAFSPPVSPGRKEINWLEWPWKYDHLTWLQNLGHCHFSSRDKELPRGVFGVDLLEALYEQSTDSRQSTAAAGRTTTTPAQSDLLLGAHRTIEITVGDEVKQSWKRSCTSQLYASCSSDMTLNISKDVAEPLPSLHKPHRQPSRQRSQRVTWAACRAGFAIKVNDECTFLMWATHIDPTGKNLTSTVVGEDVIYCTNGWGHQFCLVSPFQTIPQYPNEPIPFRINARWRWRWSSRLCPSTFAVFCTTFIRDHVEHLQATKKWINIGRTPRCPRHELRIRILRDFPESDRGKILTSQLSSVTVLTISDEPHGTLNVMQSGPYGPQPMCLRSLETILPHKAQAPAEMGWLLTPSSAEL